MKSAGPTGCDMENPLALSDQPVDEAKADESLHEDDDEDEDEEEDEAEAEAEPEPEAADEDEGGPAAPRKRKSASPEAEDRELESLSSLKSLCDQVEAEAKAPSAKKRKKAASKKANKRKNIRDILKEEELEAETRAAQQREVERVQRLQQQQQQRQQQQQQQLLVPGDLPVFDSDVLQDANPTASLVEGTVSQPSANTIRLCLDCSVAATVPFFPSNVKDLTYLLTLVTTLWSLPQDKLIG